MKKSLTMLALLAGAVSGYSQGQVDFTDYGGVLQQQIFNVQTSAPSGAQAVSVTYGGKTVNEYVGSTANAQELPPGSAVFAAGTALSGSGFDAELFTSATPNDTIADLSAVTGILHFSTTANGAGFPKSVALVTTTIPTGVTGTMAIAAWASTGVDGAATTLATAQADGYAWGFSTTGALTPNASPGPIPADIEGFSLGTVPEPSTIALGVMGASALLFRRRK